MGPVLPHLVQELFEIVGPLARKILGIGHVDEGPDGQPEEVEDPGAVVVELGVKVFLEQERLIVNIFGEQ